MDGWRGGEGGWRVKRKLSEERPLSFDNHVTGQEDDIDLINMLRYSRRVKYEQPRNDEMMQIMRHTMHALTRNGHDTLNDTKL